MESGSKNEVQGGEETELPAVVDGSEAAGRCDPKETPDTRIQSLYTSFLKSDRKTLFLLCV